MGEGAGAGSDREWAAWFRLACTPQVSRSVARRWLAAFGSAEAVVRAPEAALAAAATPRAARAWFAGQESGEIPFRRACDWLEGSPARGWLCLGDAGYPQDLLQTADPPVMLFYEGDPSCLGGPLLSIVGSRNPTAQGTQHAREFSSELARRGWVVVSGLARGVDAAAHEGALVAGGRTVAVVGTGLDEVYPPRHAELARRIAEHGLLLSEFPPGSPPRAEHFPQRNRIIAGLSRGVLVVEAALQSGSLITARLAVEAGREVWAIPGSIQSPQSRGCHALIRQGATLVEGVEDILAELSPSGSCGTVAAADPAVEGDSDDPILIAMGYDPVALDAICVRTGMPAAEVAARLLELELLGTVARLPGGLYQRTRAA